MRTAPIRLCALTLLTAITALSAVDNSTTNTPPDFDEIKDLVRANLSGATDTDVNRAAVEGLLHSLRGKVRLVNTSDDSNTRTNPPVIAKTTMLEDHIAYLRVAHVAQPLLGEIAQECEKFAATKKMTGIVLDLRFADGDDYAAAAAVANLFVATERPLLDWGSGVAKSSEKINALNWPLAVLVNGETIGAAEALAAVLRDAGAALILGNTTRGAAMTAAEFPLKNGQRLRIATAPVKLGNGSPLSTKGVKPDIEVTVTPEVERTFLDDPYATSTRTNLTLASTNSLTSTNRPARRTRPNEADLVKARRDGLSLDGEFPVGRDAEPEKPVIRDPALARAVDLLKGLAVVRRSRS